MGHIRTGPLPATRKWDQVVRLIASGSAAVSAGGEQQKRQAEIDLRLWHHSEGV